MASNVHNIRRADIGPTGPGPQIRLPPGGGDGGGGMEARIASLEAHVEHLKDDTKDIKSDVKLLITATNNIDKSISSAQVWAIGLYVALGVALLGVMAKGFHWL